MCQIMILFLQWQISRENYDLFKLTYIIIIINNNKNKL